MAKGVTRPVFIGRGAELEQLEAAFERALAGRPTAVLVVGEAGVGKTWLIGEFARRARETGALVLEGACLPLSGGAIPFLPFTGAVRTLAHTLPPAELRLVLGGARQEIARLLPELAGEAPGPAPPGEGRLARARLFELFLGVTGRLAARTAVVLVIEDLQWADDSTLDLLVFLVSSVQQARVMLVTTCRSESVKSRQSLLEALGELERRPDVERIDLARFSREELAQLAEELSGRAPSALQLDDLLERSGGNPFLAEQLIRADLPVGDDRLPARLRDILGAKLARLSTASVRAAQAVAIAGGPVAETVLSEVLDAGDHPARAIHEAIEAGILVAVDDGRGPERVGFRHQLLQEFMSDELLPSEARELHLRFARRLAADASSDPETLIRTAHHWFEADELERALPAAVEAAAAAERLFAFAEADLHYRRALELWSRVPLADDRLPIDRAALLERGAEAASLSGESERAVTMLREALADPLVLADPERGSQLHGRLRVALWRSGRKEEAIADAETLLAGMSDPGPSPGRALATAHLGALLMEQGQHERSLEVARAALQTARAVGAELEEGLALGTIGADLLELGRISEGIDHMREAWRRSLELGGALGIGLAFGRLTAALDQAGRYEEAVTIGREGLGVARRLGLERSFAPHVAGYLADALERLGRWSEATQVCREIGDRLTTGEPRSRLLLVAARVALRTGRIQEVGRMLDEAEAGASGGPVDLREASLAARIEAGQARDEQQMAVLDRDASRPGHGWRVARGDVVLAALQATVAAAERARAMGDAPAREAANRRARAHLAGLRRTQARVGDEVGRVMEVYLRHAKAEVTRLGRRSDPVAWARARSAWQERKQPYPAAYAGLREAEALVAGKAARETAEAVLREAHVAATALGARPLLGDLEGLARRARLRLPIPGASIAASEGPTAADRLGLTAREREVLGYVAAGWSNRQIAEELFISPKTASVHVSRILDMLDVEGRVNAATVAHRLGLAVPVPARPGRSED